MPAPASGPEPDPSPRRAVVTGASKGIGLGIADALLAGGTDVVLVARDPGGLAAARDGLLAAHPDRTVDVLAADTGDPATADAFLAGLDALVPVPDVVVANAGWGALVPFLDVTAEQWDAIVGLNLTGTFRLVQWAGRRMVAAAGDGRDRAILVISSIRALGARPGVAPYAATKAGLNQLVKVVALELAPHGVRINALSPGITVTPMSHDENPERLAAMTATVPMGRAGVPADMGAAAAFLCSPAAGFVTGANLVVDGGESVS